MKMFLTRMGRTAKFVVTGDMSQVDLPRKQKSGLAFALDALGEVEGVGIIRMGKSDVMRHSLVTKMIVAMEDLEEKQKQESKKNTRE
jgi:phosphate starvation-inducible PhoH-like protein